MVHVLLEYFTDRMSDSLEIGNQTCPSNCSGHGECDNGTCLCLVEFTGGSCKESNLGFFVAFGAVFYFLCFISAVQLGLCIRSEYQKQKKKSIAAALRLTNQKMLYILTIFATAIRGTYFSTRGHIPDQWSSNLLSSYYPTILTGFSLIICFWAESFHVTDIQWDQPRFLSKSFIGFLIFNAVIYSIVIAQFITTEVTDLQYSTYLTSIFNGCFACLMFIVVIFFIAYGVQVYFKVQGAFTASQNSNCRNPPTTVARDLAWAGLVRGAFTAAPSSSLDVSQLLMSRFGLVSQATLQLITALFLLSDVVKETWIDKIPVLSRNFYDVIFRLVEFGVALWFPCVLWNCSRPEQLWILNPTKILKDLKGKDSEAIPEKEGLLQKQKYKSYSSINNSPDECLSPSSEQECWICYDMERTDAGPLILPCQCRGDVAAVHHDCLKRWLVESYDKPSNLRCKVCKEEYHLQEGRVFLFQGLTPSKWMQNIFVLATMAGFPCGAFVVARHLHLVYVNILAIGLSLLVVYGCLKLLGFNLLTAYKRAKVSAVRILGKRPSMEEHPEPGTSSSSCDESVTAECSPEPIKELPRVHSKTRELYTVIS